MSRGGTMGDPIAQMKRRREVSVASSSSPCVVLQSLAHTLPRLRVFSDLFVFLSVLLIFPEFYLEKNYFSVAFSIFISFCVTYLFIPDKMGKNSGTVRT